MMDFFNWLDDLYTPNWLFGLFIIACAGIAFVLFALTIIAIVYGYWIIPVLIWIVAPAGIVAREYAKHKRGDAS